MIRTLQCCLALLLLVSFNAFGEKKSAKDDVIKNTAKTKEKTVEKAKAIQEKEAELPLTDEDGNPIGASDLPSDLEQDSNNGSPRPIEIEQKKQYPIEKVNRPLTLFHGMAEISYDLPVFLDTFSANNILAFKYGYSDALQLGLTYNVGQFDSDGFDVGRAFALDARYTLKKWVAAQVTVPIHVDPFAVALKLGAPMQFSFYDTWRFEFGEDLLSIKINDFIPRLESVSVNQASAFASATNTISARAVLDVSGHVFYQWKRNQVIEGHFGFLRSLDGTDTTTDEPVFLHLGFAHSLSNLFDLKALAGINRLDDPVETFFVQGHIAKRF